MSQIKRLLEVLAAASDGELRVVADAPIQLVRSGGAGSPLTKGLITADQWRALAQQLVPPFVFAEFEELGTAQAPLALGSRQFLVTLSRDAAGDGKLQAVVAHAAGARAVAAPPTAEVGVIGESVATERMVGLLRRQMECNGSDLHVRSSAVPLVRSSGQIQPLDGESLLSPDMVDAMLQSIMPELSRREFAETNDADFAFEVPSLGRFRVNAFRDRAGAGLVARSVPSTIITVDELGLSQEVRALSQLSKGLVLVTGPTGSGKSTTLSSLVHLVNETRNDHIITIEDPIEFVHQSKGCLITQRQVGVHTGSFKNALRAALREDPDVVLVGELRDLETVSIAIETAETGHLVFGTLHTSTAASTVDRIIDQFPPDRQSQVRVMLSESLKGVISQTLCRKIGGGRVAAMEILLVTPAVSNLIREGKTFQVVSIMQTSRKLGMVTMTDALMGLVERELVEPREAYLKAPDKSAILQALKSKGFDVSFAEMEASAKGEGLIPPNGARGPQTTPRPTLTGTGRR
jgi:twitching motility protein PilT